MSHMVQTRHSDHTPVTSGLPPFADIFSIYRHVSKVPISDIGPGDRVSLSAR